MRQSRHSGMRSTRRTHHTRLRTGRLTGLFGVLGLLLGASCQVALASTDSQSAFPALQAFVQDSHAHLSARVVDLHDGRTLWQATPQKQLIPASVSKLFVTAAALQTWGPMKRFTTRLLADGRVRNGVLHGNLVLLGGGDPALTGMQLQKLARRARKAGLRRVTGDLVVNESRFGLLSCDIKDRCKARKNARHAYAAPLSATAVNFNTWCVSVRPAPRKGRVAVLNHCEDVRGAPPIQGYVATTSVGTAARIRVSRVWSDSGAVLKVSGSIPVEDPVHRIYRGVARPGMHAALIMRQALHGHGIRVHGKNRVSFKPSDASVLASLQGQTLRQLLPRMLAHSNNFMADTLTLDLAADGGAATPLDLARAARLLTPHRPVSRAGPQPPVLLSGSGLSVGSRVSATNVTTLLSGMYHRPTLFPGFLGALTVPMYSPFSFLSAAEGLWATHTTVKTGLLRQPVMVFGVAGYARLPSGDWGAFAVLVNGTQKHPSFHFRNAERALQSDLNRLLSSVIRPAGKMAP